VADSHSILGKSSGLVAGNGIDAAQSFNSLNSLHQHILGMHTLGSDCQCYSHGGEKSFRYIGDNDSDGEHGGCKNVVTWKEHIKD
jgi:hypothetical protein